MRLDMVTGAICKVENYNGRSFNKRASDELHSLVPLRRTRSYIVKHVGRDRQNSARPRSIFLM